jgi:ABC-type amino acid transport substrate-binding protein
MRKLLVLLWAFLLLPAFVHPAFAETTYERVTRTGVIRCAYISWKPYSLKDPNHSEAPPAGSSVDIMTALANRLDLRVEWVEEIGWGTIGEGFATGRYDAVCTQMWPDAPKLRNFQLGRAMFFSDIRPYATAKTALTLSADKLDQPGTRIAAIDGGFSQRIAIEAYPHATLVNLPPSAASGEFYLNLTTGKADITLSDADEIKAQEQEGLTALIPVPNAPTVRVLPHVFAFPGDDLRFAAMMNQGLAMLQSEGFFRIIKERYGLMARAAE